MRKILDCIYRWIIPDDIGIIPYALPHTMSDFECPWSFINQRRRARQMLNDMLAYVRGE